MATELVLREVPLLCGDKHPALRAQAQGRLVRMPRWSDEKWESESVTSTPISLLSEAQVQAFQTKSAPG
jgi:hypothetical protein